MVRDSTHRPRNTEELLSIAERLKSDRDTSSTTKAGYSRGVKDCEPALITFLDTSTDGGEEEDSSDDGDTIVQLKDKSLDEEIQSTIDELQRNSLTLREASTASEEHFAAASGKSSNPANEDSEQASISSKPVDSASVLVRK